MAHLWVEDLAEGNVLSLKPAAKNKIYNLDGNEKISIKRIAETIQKNIGGVKIEYIPSRPGDFSGKDVLSNLSKEELGWEPRTNFEDGVRKYIAWYQEREERRKKDRQKMEAI